MSSGARDERRIGGQWHDRSTDMVERYELSLRGAHGVVVRQHTAGGPYAACVDDEGRQQWAGQQFDNVQSAQAWCEHVLAVRTSNEAT